MNVVEGLFTLGEVLAATGGRLLRGSSDVFISGVSTDSRQVRPGDLFVAIPGERVDGHLFVDQALERGAVAALVARPPAVGQADAGIILVENTVQALGRLAAHYRQRFDLTVIGITGSVGKTSTKDMTAGVLSQRFSVLKSEGNLNTDIGLPLTLFRLRPGHQVAVLEMAMRGLGEIAYLCRIARPRVGIVTTVGETHLELLGSLENIARAKGELVEALPEEGVAVLNGDNPWTRAMGARFAGRTIFFGEGENNAVRATDIRVAGTGMFYRLLTPEGETEVHLPFPGRHQVINSLAAAATGLAFGLELAEIRAGLEAFEPTGMRMEILEGGGITILNDAYNASPTSTRAALQTLVEMGQGRRKGAVLGGMLELGPYTEKGHAEVGAAAASAQLDYLITVGELGRLIASGALAAGFDPARVFDAADNGEALDRLFDLLQAGDFVLVKGSRGIHMEEIVEPLKERFSLASRRQPDGGNGLGIKGG